MKENAVMNEQWNTFLDTVDKLKELDINADVDFLSVLLPYCIPAHFENIKCAIQARHDLRKPDVLKN